MLSRRTALAPCRKVASVPGAAANHFKGLALYKLLPFIDLFKDGGVESWSGIAGALTGLVMMAMAGLVMTRWQWCGCAHTAGPRRRGELMLA